MGWKMIRIMFVMFSLGIIFFPSSLYSELICFAPNGCPIKMETGECKNCIWKEDKTPEPPKIITETNKKSVFTEKKTDPPKKRIATMKPKKTWVGTLWKCVVGCRSGVSFWDDGGNDYDANLNLVSKY